MWIKLEWHLRFQYWRNMTENASETSTFIFFSPNPCVHGSFLILFYLFILINAFAVLLSKVYFCIREDILKPSCHLLLSDRSESVPVCVLFGSRGANVWKEEKREESAVGSPDCCGSWKNEITWMLSQTFLDVTPSTVWSASYSWHLMT